MIRRHSLENPFHLFDSPGLSRIRDEHTIGKVLAIFENWRQGQSYFGCGARHDGVPDIVRFLYVMLALTGRPLPAFADLN